jgi:hypothetical protein
MRTAIVFASLLLAACAQPSPELADSPDASAGVGGNAVPDLAGASDLSRTRDDLTSDRDAAVIVRGDLARGELADLANGDMNLVHDLAPAPSDLTLIGTCAHKLCQYGKPLVDYCHPCVRQICVQDSWCCTASKSWNQQCIDEVASICGLSCN